MAFFKYQARDAAGATVAGSLDASDAASARERLARMGLGAIVIDGGAPIVTPSPRNAPPSMPATSRPAAASRTAIAEQPAAISIEETEDESRCPIMRNKDRAFFFDQLGRFLRSGLGAARALEQLGTQSRGRPAAFLLEAARRTAGGQSIGDAMRGGYITQPERDALLAAERGGYLPDGCDALAKIAMDGHVLGRGAIYPLILIGLGCLLGPLNHAVVKGSLKSMAQQDAAGGTLPVWSTLGKTTNAPLALGQGMLLALGVYALYRLWIAPFNRRTRHALAAKLPPLRNRSRSEALTTFSWNLSMLGRAGISPHESVRLSAATAPNLTLRRELLGGLGGLPVGTKLSDALGGTSLVSVQYRNIVENGELTGDVPGALTMVARAEESEFEVRQKRAGTGIYFFLFFAGAIAITVIVGMAVAMWRDGVIKMFIQDA